MRKALAAALLAALLVSALAGTLLINPSKANFSPEPPDLPVVTVLSPESEKTYSSNSVNLTFTVGHYRKPTSSWIQYYLDGRLLGQLNDYAPKSFSVVLTGLSEGQHYVEVREVSYFYRQIRDAISGRIYFTVDTAVPRVSVLTLQGRTFEGAEVPFNFTVSKQVSWVGYCLDGADAVMVSDAVVTQTYGRDNYYIVLTDLAAGSHSLTVYAEDEAGHAGESEAVGFTVAGEAQPQTEQPEPFPIALVVASVAIVAVGATLLVYFKKRKH